MRKIFVTCLFVVLVSSLAISFAGQKKAEKLTGKITCAKCDLKVADDCATVIVTKQGGKDVTYYFDEKADKAHHGSICQTPKEGTVTGTVTDKDGKKYINVEKVEFKN